MVIQLLVLHNGFLVESVHGPDDTKEFGRLMRSDLAWPVVAYKNDIFKYVLFSYSGIYPKQKLEEIWEWYRQSVKR